MGYNFKYQWVMLFTVICFVNNVQAKQNKVVYDGSELAVSISIDQLTRIKIAEDRISSVKLNQGELELLEDTKLGDVYIKPTSSRMSQISVFITTEKGRTYKLLLIPKKIPAEQIFLNDQEEPDRSFEKYKNAFKHNVVKLIKYMRSLEASNAPKVDAEQGTTLGDRDFVRTRSIKKLGFVGDVLEYTNKSDEYLALDALTLLNHNKENWVALSLEKSELTPQETTLLYVVMEEAHGKN